MRSIVLFAFFLYGTADASETQTIARLFSTHGRYFGSALQWNRIATDSLYRRHAFHFSIATPEGEMKFNAIQKTRNHYTFKSADSIVAFCAKNGILVRGHTLIWGGGLPDWMLKADYPRDTLRKIMKEHVSTVVGHYKNRLYCWDVVNEAIDDNGGMVSNIYFKKLGETYIDSAFTWARLEDPNVKLFYNDYYKNYGRDEYKKKLEITDALIDRLQKHNIPLDGIGFQMHMALDKPIDLLYLKHYLNKFAEKQLELHFTEIDVAIDTPVTEIKLRKQAAMYADITKLFLSIPSCKAFVAWGFTDACSWIPSYSKGTLGAACLFDSHYRPKPAYYGIKNILEKKSHK